MNPNPEFIDRPDEAPAPAQSQPSSILPPLVWHETPDALERKPWLMPFRDSILTTGLMLLAISAGLFGLYAFVLRTQPAAPDMMLFFLHYAIAIGYAILVKANGIWEFREASSVSKRAARWVSLLLFLISAFALNRDVAVFQQSTDWLCGALVAAGAAMTAYAWTPYLGVRVQQGIYVVLAGSVWLFAYASVFVAELYLVSFPALILLGLSVHTFIPLLITTTLGRRLWADYRANEHLRPAIWVGFSLPVIVTSLFFVAWSQNLERIETVRNEAVLRRTEDLPDWVLMAQQIESKNPVTHWIMNRMLGVGLHYDEGPFSGNWGGGLSGLTAMDDVKEHDPLVVMANRLFPPSTLSDPDKISLLKTVNSDRHLTEEKFWSGRHLSTQGVVTQARIWPQFRLAYTEKTIRVRNAAEMQTGEALYTFYLPTGSVVTSMSLWINGKEEKARLTTVAKADSAYRQVVNVESRLSERDPAVVYWQEGGRVTVRVFPCPAGQERQVKLGVTSPLRLEGNELVYENPWFDGPTASGARETGQIDFDQQPVGLSAPFAFEKGAGGQLAYRGDYKPEWSLRVKAPALSAEPFVLDGMAYQLTPYQPKTAPFSPETVYLDINAAWSLAEFETVWRAVKHKPVFVYDDGLAQLTDANRAGFFERLSQQQFSLFPIYRIENPDQSLLITQSTDQSLFLNDLKGTRFAERLTQSAAKNAPLRAVNISPETAGYLKTLAELRALNLAPASAQEIEAGLGLKTFPILNNQPNTVAIPGSGVVCSTTPYPERNATKAPDHLARLYGYNHLVAGIGRQYFDASYRKNDALLAEAQHAHVLSPLSSLIVLESEFDYDRFGIKKDTKGLENATLNEEGAVPEPHEWAMIVLLGLVVLWLRRHKWTQPFS